MKKNKGFYAYNNFPLTIDNKGSTLTTKSQAEHIKQLIEQILFTIQGERVNRPTFGTGINQLVFEPNSEEIAIATQFLIQGSLQQWMSDTIQVEAVDVKSEDATLNISIQYIIRNTLSREIISFTK